MRVCACAGVGIEDAEGGSRHMLIQNPDHLPIRGIRDAEAFRERSRSFRPDGIDCPTCLKVPAGDKLVGALAAAR